MTQQGLSQVEIDRGLARIFEFLFADEIEQAIKGSQDPKEKKQQQDGVSGDDKAS